MSVEDFIEAIDRVWSTSPREKVCLPIIGCAALMLQTRITRGTKDSDILETPAFGEAKGQLEALAGPETRLAKRHGMYIEFVPPGLPFLPQQPTWHDISALNARLRHFRVQALDIVDVVVTKLFRFSADDRSDIDAMVAGGHIDQERLVRRFESAMDLLLHDARADRLPACIENLNTVERDYLLVDETFIEVPDWAIR